MDEKTFNLGMTLAYPYESKYSIWRRFLSANQLLKVEEICQHFDVPFKYAEDRRRAPGTLFPKLLQTVFAPQGAPGYLELFESVERETNFFQIDRHCPDCAKSGYHTDLYRLPWLTECPIHQNELVAKCPECGKDWPTWDEISKRKCSTCGLIKLTCNPREHCLLRSEDFKAIHDLMAFVSFKPLKPLVLLAKELHSTRQRASISYFHPYFPAVQYERHPEHSRHRFKRFINSSNPPQITTHRVSIVVNENEFTRLADTFYAPKERYIPQENTRKRVFDKIVSTVTRASDQVHQPRLFNVATLNPEDLFGPTRPCWYCLALSYWEALTRPASFINANNHFSGMNNLTMWQNDDLFQGPKYWSFVVSSGVSYKLDDKTKNALYYIELENFFIVLFESLYELEKCAKPSRGLLEEVWLKSFSRLSDRLALFFYHEENELIISVINHGLLPDESSLAMSTCPKRCEDYEKYLYDKKLYGLIEAEVKAAVINDNDLFATEPANMFDRKFVIPSLRLSQGG